MIYAIIALVSFQYHHNEIERLHRCVTLLNRRSAKGLDQ